MNRYIAAYIAWIAAVLVMAAVAVAWYRKVEEIGLREVADRMSRNGATDDPEATGEGEWPLNAPENTIILDEDPAA